MDKVRSEDVPAYMVTQSSKVAEDDVIANALAILETRLRARRGVDDRAFERPEAAASYCRLRFASCEREQFSALFLDTRHRLIECVTLSQGTIDSASVYPREVVKAALKCNAAAVIFTHNHPSGNPEPSAADQTITRRLVDALAPVEVRVLDHLIVGEGSAVSMAAKGML